MPNTRYTLRGQPVPGGEAVVAPPSANDWFAQQGAPGGGAVTPAQHAAMQAGATPGGAPGNPLYGAGGVGGGAIPGGVSSTIGAPYGVTGRPPGGTAPGGRMTNAQAQQFFDQLFPGETVSPEDLEAHRAELEAAGFQLNPNAAGRITDLRLPSGDFVDPIYGAGSGLNRKQWNIEGPGAGGGAGGPLAALQASPGYQFRLGEGAKALERSAAAKGTLLTGGTLKGLSRFAQDYASGEYQNRYNQLAGLATLGANAAVGQGSANSAYANQAGNTITDIGNAQAAGTVGRQNAYQNVYNQGTNLAQQYWLSRMLQPGGGAGSGVTLPPGAQGPLLSQR